MIVNVNTEVLYMAKYKYNKKEDEKKSFKKIQDTEGSGFGEYDEDTGGGKPFGTSNTRTTRENGKYRQANNDTLQPRTNDGKFTYKSVNGQSIDPKYGPSRGKTVNPLLTGGKNGIMIEDVKDKQGNTVQKGVKTQFAEKQGEIWEKYKDKWYVKGSEKIDPSTFKTHVAGKAIWEIAQQRYDQVKQMFGGEIEWDENAKEWVATEKGGEDTVFSEVKKGKPSEEEKTAKQAAYASGEEQNVIDKSTQSIKTAPGKTAPLTTEPKKYKPMFTNKASTNPTGKPWKPKMATPTMTMDEYEASMIKPSQAQPAPAPVSQPAPAPQAQAAPQAQPAPQAAPAPQAKPLKYTNENFEQVISYLQNKFSGQEKLANVINKFKGLTPEEKVKQIDIWKSKGVNFGF